MNHSKLKSQALGILGILVLPLFCLASNLPSDSIFHSDTKWTNHQGTTISLRDFQGQPTIISMVYLSCQHTCPLTVSKMKALAKDLGKKASQVNFVLVSFDPKHDSPATMRSFMKTKQLTEKNWTMMTSDDESSLRELSGLIDFKYKKVSDDEFEHSLALIALNTEGRVIGRIEGAGMNVKLLTKKLLKK